MTLWTGWAKENVWAPERDLAIADLGCGNERLREVLADRLSEPFHYQGYDLRPQLPSTIRLDVRRSLPERQFDLAFCLGLLEYLPRLGQFLPRLRGLARFAIVSYVLADAPQALSTADRRRRGWTTHHTRPELGRLCERAGFDELRFTVIDGGSTGLWLCESSS